MQMPRFAVLAAALLLTAHGAARAEEGMWTFEAFPSARVAADHGVTIDKPWLDRVQAGAVRLTSGCSGSVVSEQGLVLTNHHCVIACIQAMSDAGADYLQSGFLTVTRAEERQCPGMQAEILEAAADLTAQVAEATAGKSGQAFVKARDAVAAKAEDAACADAARYRCELVALHRGGAFTLYKYRKHPDVRLVFAPEYAIGFFGGDPDNFNFPRYNFDVAFVRLYEDGRPVATPRRLKLAGRAPAAGEPTFVAGSPGSTDRQMTMAQLESQRDVAIPLAQLQRSELRGRLIRFSEESAEHERIARAALFSVENAFKVYYGRQAALSDPAFMARLRAAETELRAKVASDLKLSAEIGDPWQTIELAQIAFNANHLRYRQIESAAGGGSDLFYYARRLVRAAQERERPPHLRLADYAASRLPLMRKELLDPQPVDRPVEEIHLGFWLSKTREYLSADDPAVRLLLGKESPEGLARRLVAESRLADPAVRQALWDGGLRAVRASDDPLIRFALKIDPLARDIRGSWEREVSGPVAGASEKIARARFAVYGDSIYPDATRTLRLSYGKVAGWRQRGETVPPTTDFAGLYARAGDAAPYALPPRWLQAQARLNGATAFNFVTTNDIIGGNSGSPVLDAKGEAIGVVFDGNIHSLGGNYGYDAALNRTVAVSAAAIMAALETVYGRTALVRELTAP